MEKNYEFREKLLQVHKPDRVTDEVWKKIPGLVIDSSWTIYLPKDAGIVVKNAALDLQEYFHISLRLDLEIVSEPADRQIRYASDLTTEKPSYRISADTVIILDGTDEKMTAQASYALEDQMNMNEGPVVQLQDEIFTPMFSPRIIGSGIGGGLFPDEHLRAIAHAGIDTVMVGARGVLDDPDACKRINDLVDRAAAYGMGVYTSAGFKNGRHPSDPDAWEHYDAMYGELFRRCPGLKGMFIVGESCEFPSHDPRTTGKTWRESIGEDKPSPGWFPCDDYPAFVSFLRDVIHSVNPQVDIVFWTYNWGYIDTDLRIELINKMPTDITMMATYEMFEQFHPRPGVTEICTDYTIYFAGPGHYFASEAKAAAARGINFISMTNTGGNTWDIGVVPYVPAPGQWIKRYEGIVDAHENLTLNGLRESHTYGFWPSFLPELAKAAYTAPRQDLYAYLKKLAVRDYGADNADTVLDAWEHFSEGMRHCIPTNEDQYGPCRIGPSYPLFFEKWENIPQGPTGNGNPNRTCLAVYRFNPDLMERLIYEIEEYGKMTDEFKLGNDLLTSVIPTLPEHKQAAAKEALTVSRFIENTARTTWHVKRWHKAKIHLGVYVDHKDIWAGGRDDMLDAKSPVKPLDIRPDRETWIKELITIAEAELKNAEETIPLVRENSRLGYTQELDYACSEEQIVWKINRLKKTLEEEVLPLK